MLLIFFFFLITPHSNFQVWCPQLKNGSRSAHLLRSRVVQPHHKDVVPIIVDFSYS
jgi:hypothetical protein